MNEHHNPAADLGELTPDELDAIRAARARQRPPARGAVAIPSVRRRAIYRTAGLALGALLAVALLLRLAQFAADNPLAAALITGAIVLMLRSHAISAARHTGRAWRWLRARR